MQRRDFFLAASSVTASAALAQPVATMHDAALSAFRAGRWAAAYGRFAALADRGHAPSAQVALLMLDQGPWLFGSHWSATAPQRRRWEALVETARRTQRNGRPTDDE